MVLTRGDGRLRDHLVLTGLDKRTEPASLKDLREAPEARVSTVDLPELLLEVHAWTGLLNHWHHASEAGSRAEPLRLANVVLVDYQATLPIVGHWGQGSGTCCRRRIPVGRPERAGPPMTLRRCLIRGDVLPAVGTHCAAPCVTGGTTPGRSTCALYRPSRQDVSVPRPST
jgi:hypothetical protein